MSDIARRSGIVDFEREDAFGVRGVRWTSTGMQLPLGLAFPDYEHVGWVLGHLRDMSGWALGDWVNQGEAIYGEKYAQAIQATGRSESGLMNLASVARRVPRSMRRANLSWSHHEAVASRDFVEQARWLDRAEAEGLSVEVLRGLLREERNLPASVDPSPPNCEHIVNDTVRDLHAALRECGFEDDLAVSVRVVAGPVEFEARLP